MAETTTHIFDAAPKPLRSPVALLPELWMAVCSCGWHSPFDCLRVEDARQDWDRHVRRWAS